MRRILGWLIVGACAGAAPLPAGPEHGFVELRVRDAETGAPLTARVSLTRGDTSLIGEEVVDGEGEVLAGLIGHLPAVHLVHLVQALTAHVIGVSYEIDF